ncbi:MAG: DUF2812 domain-containing protein [Coriobacteriia bacterium]|nr:DUF2812 domain-containing protein [Coriobacteriia bacterium]
MMMFMSSSMNAASASAEQATQKEFKLPKWKSIAGEVYTMHNWDLQYDLLAAEEFLNNMLSCGWRPVCVSRGTKFSFVPCVPGEYTCRTILTVGTYGSFDKKKAGELAELLAADGACIVPQEKTWGGQTGLIALKASSLGSFEIVSDLDSRIEEYALRKKYADSLGALFLFVGVAQLVAGIGAFLSSDVPLLTFFPLSVIWFSLAYYYYRPAPRYKKILTRLKAERDISET